MPGIFMRLLRDENQEDWVEEVDEIQPQLDFTISWNKDRLNVPTEEQMVKVFKRFLAATAICEPYEKKDKLASLSDTELNDFDDVEEDDD